MSPSLSVTSKYHGYYHIISLEGFWRLLYVSLVPFISILVDEILKDLYFAGGICQCHGTSRTLDPWKISAGSFTVKMPSVIRDEHGPGSPTEDDQE